MKRKDMLIQRQQSIIGEYKNKMLEISRNYPCVFCVSDIKYALKDGILHKICENDCKHLNEYNKTIEEITAFYQCAIDKTIGGE